jgi:streptogramin lyase
MDMRFDRRFGILVGVCCLALFCTRRNTAALQDPHAPLTFASVPTTLVTLPNDSEGLTVDPTTGTLYAAEAPDASGTCVVRSITMSGTTAVVGIVPKPLGGACSPRGLEFRNGRLYVSDQGTGPDGWVFEMDPVSGQATTFASGVPGANGIAFDARGNLWITDSLRGLGRVYRRDAETGVVREAFRVPGVANGTTYGGLLTQPSVLGVGRQFVNVPVGMQPEVRQVANGIAVSERYSDEATSRDGAPGTATLYVADTARGALWAVKLDQHGELEPGQTGCNPTYQSHTLCEDALFVAHPRLEGADGISVDDDGSLLIAANQRQGLVRVDRKRNVTELFRNPVNSQLLRSSADTAEGNRHILEYPSNPVIVPAVGGWPMRTICVTSIDRPGRDNWPGTVGEIGGLGQDRGKISCF